MYFLTCSQTLLLITLCSQNRATPSLLHHCQNLQWSQLAYSQKTCFLAAERLKKAVACIHNVDMIRGTHGLQVTHRCLYKCPLNINTQLVLLSKKGRDRPNKKTQYSGLADLTPELDNQLDSLDSRIFEIEIPPLISQVSNIDLLLKY